MQHPTLPWSSTQHRHTWCAESLVSTYLEKYVTGIKLDKLSKQLPKFLS